MKRVILKNEESIRRYFDNFGFSEDASEEDIKAYIAEIVESAIIDIIIEDDNKTFTSEVIKNNVSTNEYLDENTENEEFCKWLLEEGKKENNHIEE